MVGATLDHPGNRKAMRAQADTGWYSFRRQGCTSHQEGIMGAQPRDFLLPLVVLAAATAAFGQSASVTPPAAAIPDFSGIWAHPYLTGFEPPASGPGPVTNR